MAQIRNISTSQDPIKFENFFIMRQKMWETKTQNVAHRVSFSLCSIGEAVPTMCLYYPTVPSLGLGSCHHLSDGPKPRVTPITGGQRFLKQRV